MFTKTDIEQFNKTGISTGQVTQQVETFIKGIPYIKLNRAAIPNDGIIQLSTNQQDTYVRAYNKNEELTCMKFVPASGAASRMFKELFTCLEEIEHGNNSISKGVVVFFQNIKKFAFYNRLDEKLCEKNIHLDDLLREENYLTVLKTLLYENGLRYGSLPKGLLDFHRYADTVRTPFEEHLLEGAKYAANSNNTINMHFTVSPEHQSAFEVLKHRIVPFYENKFHVKYKITFSVQDPATDTIAVTSENKPFRNEDGSIVFRPGGHGALIHNLNKLDADIIFIKNIDNVAYETFLNYTVQYKKVLAGKLIEIRSKVFDTLHKLDKGSLTAQQLEDILDFIENELMYTITVRPDTTNVEQTVKYLHKLLHRPIRVCGVVKNTGEAGGGPFWAPNSLGDITLQIIEASQVDMNTAQQKQVFTTSTHFNPVDIVCCTKDYKGQKFDLLGFIDSNTSFISHKTLNGKALKALELPGLWNGAMADWISIFIEVPIETFNPVKTVLDLLRNTHQP